MNRLEAMLAVTVITSKDFFQEQRDGLCVGYEHVALTYSGFMKVFYAFFLVFILKSTILKRF